MKLPVPNYPKSHATFKKRPYYKRWAKEHEKMVDLHNRTKIIDVEPQDFTEDDLQIPTKYLVTFHVKSIVNIDEQQQPIFADKHVAEFGLPPDYPVSACTIYMKTPVWHPNIRFKGNFKGRVCPNSDLFGPTYFLDQLVLRVGEILQYKNYHALQTWPYPDDVEVAKWVLQFAEPNGIVDKQKEIAVDDQPLISDDSPEELKAKPKIKIKSQKEGSQEPPQRLRLNITKKDPNTTNE